MKAIFDLEGTLTKNKWREIHVHQKRWDEFNILLPYDKPNTDVILKLVQARSMGFEIVILTSKFEEYRKISEEWLIKHRVWAHISEMVMREEGNYEKSPLCKERYVKEHRRNIAFAYDDRADIIQMYRSYNIPAILVENK